ncbi:MAG: transketolase [Candidatus Tagabacteria bacterium CG10_big_fil_rev_8_21_14_0_10_40_13]|uniref:Transketolase n=1 Tax=Candidatus Tagabacteria bacterium CG10_big_fil_rev_8_21_14_0_10_40_13 TaxID=1975022 RepID=A0A2M8L9I9_9BACT|nr:MAG: transketolase [Candidatus Tagabacteria bacterium CG10_big_fil_rev_8_21_14_0_10_40_13]
MHLSDEKIKFLETKANEIRQDIIKMLLEAGSGHSAGSLGMADIFTAFYFHILKHNPEKPDWEERDRLVLSNGHICPVLYAAMAHAGYFPVKELMTLRKFGTRLQGHPHKSSLPGLENSSGPIAHGMGIAVGMAIAAKMDSKKYQVYCLVGDGGQDEGMTWEAAALAGKWRLDNLTFVMDRNNIQIDGYTEDVMPKEPLRDKYEAFGWRVIDVDGHNIGEFVNACDEAKAIFEKPVMIIAHTIPGKGVDFMEGKFEWHGRTPNEDEAKEALRQLQK